jgi:PKD repeat protein
MATAVLTVDTAEYYKTHYIVPGITLTSGYAPFPVFFEGWQSTPRSDLVKYAWDFGAGTEGDEGGRYFEGFNAAHIFETVGTYTVTLTVTDYLGSTDTGTVSITVNARNSAGTYYVDSDIGNDAYDGTAATVADGHGPWRTANKPIFLMQKTGGVYPFAPGDRILFNRGQIFEFSGHMATGAIGMTYVPNNEFCKGVQIGAYGDPQLARPVIRWVGTSDVVNGLPASAYVYDAAMGGTDIVFSDLNFQMLNPSNGSLVAGLLFAPSGWKSIVFLRVNVSDSAGGFITMEGASNRASGMFIISCTFDNELTSQNSGTHMYGSFSRIAILNSRFDNAGNHICYLTAIDKAAICDNVFSRPAFGRTALRISGGTVADPGNNICVKRNRFLGWTDPMIGGSGRSGGSHNGGGTRMNYRLIDFAPNAAGEKVSEWIHFEGNVVTNYEQGLGIDNLYNGSVINNLFVTPIGGTAIILNSHSAGGAFRPLKNLNICGNVAISGSKLDGDGWVQWAPIIVANPYDGLDNDGTLDVSVTVKNNIIATYAGGRAQVSLDVTGTMPGLDCNNNLYYMPSVVGGAHMRHTGTTYTVPNWRAAFGLDADSIETAPVFAGDPISELNDRVPGVPASQVACAAEAATLIAQLPPGIGSPALGAGVSQGAKLYYDFDGTQRATPPSIGAFDVYGEAPPANQAPVVNAGADQSITLPFTASLSGTATDDGLPSATLTTTWSKVSGPGTVTFGNANSLTTTATFSTAGSYVLRLTATDGALTTTDDVTITVNAAPAPETAIAYLNIHRRGFRFF